MPVFGIPSASFDRILGRGFLFGAAPRSAQPHGWQSLTQQGGRGSKRALLPLPLQAVAVKNRGGRRKRPQQQQPAADIEGADDSAFKVGNIQNLYGLPA